MRFIYEGAEYEILFNRDHKQVEVIDRKRNEKRTEQSRYPATIAMILRVDNTKKAQFWEVINSAEVICDKSDKFTLESGRRYALRKLEKLIPHGMVGPMYQAYFGREKGVNLHAQNRDLRHQVSILSEMNKKLIHERNQWQDNYHKLLSEGSDA